MKYFVSFCLAAAVVLGAATAPVFGCGGSSGQTGCKVAASPLTIAGLRFWIGVLDAFIP